VPGPSKAPEATDEREEGADANDSTEARVKRGPTLHDGEPAFERSEDEDEFDEDTPEFPTTHELLLKDHTKVITALALDPSGARIVTGSHDYDCKLWDFGGMDHRCKPFKSWEPAGSYYVSIFSPSSEISERGFYIISPRR
jgi:WD40 repeat protein